MDALLNPIIKKYLGSIIRAGLMLLTPALVSQGIWTPEEATATTTAIATALAAVAWSLFEKYRSQQKLLTATATAGLTEQQVEQKVKAGLAPPVTVPKDVAPFTPLPKR